MDDQKVNVKLQKHIWPDELKQQKKKRSTGLLMVFICLSVFLIGTLIGSIITRSNQVSVNNPIIEENPRVTLTQNQQFQKFQNIYDILTQQWYFSSQMDDPNQQIMDNAIKGMIEQNGDPHTSYMTAEELAAFEDGINQNYVGIGVQYYQVDGISIVLKVFNDSPADQAGVLPGDIFHTVDGKDVTDLDQDVVSEMVRGQEGTSVNIEFKRNEEIVEMDIIRGPITSTTFAEMVEQEIGYLEINSFGNSTGEQVKRELEMLRDQGASKLVIDVRDNGGGYLHALNQIASFFLESNQVIIAQEDVDGNIVNTYSTGKTFDNFEEIVMLINQNSASASEVLALALRDNLDIELVGTKSFGKGTVQTTIPLFDGSNLKYTTAQWLSPQGKQIHEDGIEPTIEVIIHEVFHIPTPYLEDGETIEFDQVHEGLVFVQQALDFLGYPVDRVDGYYSQGTLDAYHQYLSDNDLEETDIINRESIAGLSSRVYQHYNQNLKELDIQLEKAIEILR